jgi:hypothetical protein
MYRYSETAFLRNREVVIIELSLNKRDQKTLGDITHQNKSDVRSDLHNESELYALGTLTLCYQGIRSSFHRSFISIYQIITTR